MLIAEAHGESSVAHRQSQRVPVGARDARLQRENKEKSRQLISAVLYFARG